MPQLVQNAIPPPLCLGFSFEETPPPRSVTPRWPDSCHCSWPQNHAGERFHVAPLEGWKLQRVSDVSLTERAEPMNGNTAKDIPFAEFLINLALHIAATVD